MAQNTAAGTFTPTYRDLNPGTPGKRWAAESGQPILHHQGLTVAENGPCCARQVQGTGVGPEGQEGHGAGALACFLIILYGPRVRGNFKKTFF